MRAMLAKDSIERSLLDAYVENDDYWFQPKYDGHRVLVTWEQGAPSPDVHNRVGEPSQHEKQMKALFNTRFSGVIDGELVESIYVVFDYFDPSYPKMPYKERLAAAKEIVESQNEQGIYLVVTSRFADSKASMVEVIERLEGEGIIIRDPNSPYISGRSNHLIKCKFTQTTDVVVVETHIDDKEKFSFGKYKDGELQTLGTAKLLIKDLEPGDVVELRYLYLTDSGRYYQPVALRKRNDKKAEECQ